MNGLSNINIELTSRCNKSCFCCGRRKMEREHPELCNWGSIRFEMLERIAEQIPKGVFIQLHNSGEPLLYPHLFDAIKLFEGHYVGLNTNGKLLMEQQEAINQLSSITISIIPDDPEGDEQLRIAREFLQYKDRPLTIFRLLGDINVDRKAMIYYFEKNYPRVIICHRILHAPEGSHDYEKPVTKPEIGICLEMLHKLAIDRFGNVYPCVRYDPERKNLLGHVDMRALESIWEGPTRKKWIEWHIRGERDPVPLCQSCDFWGVARGLIWITHTS